MFKRVRRRKFIRQCQMSLNSMVKVIVPYTSNLDFVGVLIFFRGYSNISALVISKKELLHQPELRSGDWMV